MSRNHILDAILSSRSATQRLVELMQAPTLDYQQIAWCMEGGALLEDATWKIMQPGVASSPSLSNTMTPIRRALQEDREDLVRLFYTSRSLDIRHQDNWLSQAGALDARKSFFALISMGAMGRSSPQDRAHLLRGALVGAKPWQVEALLQAGCDPNTQDKLYDDHFTRPLHWAGDPESVGVMLAHGARLDGLDSYGAPPLGSMIRRLSENQRAGRQGNAKLLDAIHAIIDAGSPLVQAPDQRRQNGWSAIECLCSGTFSDPHLMKRLAQTDPERARQCRIRSIEVAAHLLDTGVIEDLDLLSRKIGWRSISLYKREDVQAVEALLERGVPPPKLSALSDSNISQWMEIGIPMTREEIEHRIRQAEEAEMDGNYEDLHVLEDQGKIDACNALAEARKLRISTQKAPSQKSSLRL